MDIIGTGIAVVLTLMVFSYILGDNFLFRLASHIFVGVGIGYAIIVLWYEVFAPMAAMPTEQFLYRALPALILCLPLLFRLLPTQDVLTRTLGNITLAFVLGVGAAIAIGGALFGTLIPQVAATMNLSLNPAAYDPDEAALQIVSNILILLGTIGTFFYFTFTVRPQMILGGLREGIVRFLAGVGRLIIIFTLASLFANAVTSRVAVLVSRLQFLTGFLR